MRIFARFEEWLFTSATPIWVCYGIVAVSMLYIIVRVMV